MEVLIADDDALTRDMLQHALEQSGYTVLTAADGQQAAEILRRGTCQILVTDWHMPNLNGIDLCRLIRGAGFSDNIFIIMLTGNDRPQDVLAGFAAGADDFLKKPFDPAELIARIRSGERLMTLEASEMTLFALAKLAESRDSDTGAHLERVRSYSKVVAEHLGTQDKFRQVVNAEFVRLIYQTSPLHDIGKVAVPDCVLLKPARLSDEEFEIMKRHTLHGAATLGAAMAKYPNAKFLVMARDIALHHHEKFDGRGYPHNLAGQAIPLAARIVTLADVYDALSSRRVYKAAYTHLVARGIIVQDSGKHFDPDIVEAFLAVEKSFLQIRSRYDESSMVAAA